MAFRSNCSTEAHLIHDLVREAIVGRKPFIYGKIGGMEHWQLGACRKAAGRPLQHSDINYGMLTNSGVFPLTSPIIKSWCESHIAAAHSFSINIEWKPGFKRDRPWLTSVHALFYATEVDSMWPWYWEQPFTRFLENRTVLVVSPFVDYIDKQYPAKREAIWPRDPRILPRNITLKFIKAPLPPWDAVISVVNEAETVNHSFAFRGRAFQRDLF